MDITSSVNEDSVTVALSGDITVNGVCDLSEAMKRALDEGSQIVVDLSGVTGIDTAGLQVLVSSKKSAEEARKPFRLTGGSEAFLKSAMRGSFESCLEMHN
jgi:anti-sigma B factor antagonist